MAIFPKDFSLDDFNHGNQQAFNQVYHHAASSLLEFVQARIENPTAAKDIVAEAWYKLYDHVKKYPFNSYRHILRWLYRVVVNGMIDHIRVRNKTSTELIDLSNISDDSHLDDLIEIDQVKRKVISEVMHAVENLPHQRRAVLKMYFLEQKETDEIALALGLNRQTVLNTKSKALHTLRNKGFKLFDDGLTISLICLSIYFNELLKAI